MESINVVLKNETGLHARPASQLVNLVNQFECEILINKDDNIYNPRSMMSILSMDASQGTALQFTADGIDEIEAIKAINALINNNFGE